MNTTAKYGYVVTTTPGLLEEGSFPVNRKGNRANCENSGDPDSIVPVFATEEEATAAMIAFTPAGEDPAVWAGYSVAHTYDAAPLHLAHDMVEGQDGFQVPALTA